MCGGRRGRPRSTPEALGTFRWEGGDGGGSWRLQLEARTEGERRAGDAAGDLAPIQVPGVPRWQPRGAALQTPELTPRHAGGLGLGHDSSTPARDLSDVGGGPGLAG